MSVSNVSGSNNIWQSVLEKMSSEKTEESSVQEQTPIIETDSKDEEVSLNLETEETISQNIQETETQNAEEKKGSFEYISNLLKLEDKTADDFRIIKDNQDRITYMDNQIKLDEGIENNIINGYKIVYGENGDVMITPFSMQSLIASETTTYKEDGSKSVVKKDSDGKILSELNYDKDGKEIKSAETASTSEATNVSEVESTAEPASTTEIKSADETKSTSETSSASETVSSDETKSTSETSSASETVSSDETKSTSETSSASETASLDETKSTSESSSASETKSKYDTNFSYKLLSSLIKMILSQLNQFFSFFRSLWKSN